jgi:hypothetical protein
MGKEDPKKTLTNDKIPIPTTPPSSLPFKPPQYSEPPNGCLPLQQAVVGRGQVYVPFQLSDLREIKKDLGI